MARYESVLDLIGDTPLLDVSALSPNRRVQIFAKLEGNNPRWLGQGSCRQGDDRRG
jgi:[CysO sulfur-carrier protein]-thiocarboxylate-dependent cysteine synthase